MGSVPTFKIFCWIPFHSNLGKSTASGKPGTHTRSRRNSSVGINLWLLAPMGCQAILTMLSGQISLFLFLSWWRNKCLLVILGRIQGQTEGQTERNYWKQSLKNTAVSLWKKLLAFILIWILLMLSGFLRILFVSLSFFSVTYSFFFQSFIFHTVYNCDRPICGGIVQNGEASFFLNIFLSFISEPNSDLHRSFLK